MKISPSIELTESTQPGKKMRAGKGFETIECYTGLKDVPISGDSVVLLECMSNLTANEMFEENGAHQNTVEEILAGVQKLKERVRHMVIVTNEIFSDGVTFDEEMNTYLRYLGEINQAVAKMADEAVEVVYGIPIWQNIFRFQTHNPLRSQNDGSPEAPGSYSAPLDPKLHLLCLP